jgi:hypothetical protein
MFGSSGAHDLGYAANAILIGLIKALVSNGTLTKNQAADILDDARRVLQPFGHTDSIGRAMGIVDDVKRRVAA